MGLVFRKQKRLGGFLSLNASRRGLGVSVGPRGAKMSVGIAGKKKGQVRTRVGTGNVYMQKTSSAKQRRKPPRGMPKITEFPREMTLEEYYEAQDLWDDVGPFVKGTKRGDKVELDEDIVRKLLRMQELTGYELVDTKAARAALDDA